MVVDLFMTLSSRLRFGEQASCRTEIIGNEWTTKPLLSAAKCSR